MLHGDHHAAPDGEPGVCRRDRAIAVRRRDGNHRIELKQTGRDQARKLYTGGIAASRKHREQRQVAGLSRIGRQARVCPSASGEFALDRGVQEPQSLSDRAMQVLDEAVRLS